MKFVHSIFIESEKCRSTDKSQVSLMFRKNTYIS